MNIEEATDFEHRRVLEKKTLVTDDTEFIERVQSTCGIHHQLQKQKPEENVCSHKTAK